MANRDELISVLRSLLTEQFAPKPRYIRAVLGDGRGNVVVPGNPDRSYARFTRDSTTYFEVFNRTVNPVNDWPILVGELPWQPGLTQVVDTDWSVFEQSGWGDELGNTSPHAPTHVRRDGSIGSDPLDVYLPMLAPARAYTTVAAPSTVYVNALEYGTTGTFWQGLPGIDLQPLMDATVTGTMRFAGVYIDTSTNTLGVVTGSTTVHTSAFDPPRVSFPATNAIPVARVKLYGGQAALSEVNDFRDARRPFSVGGGGGAPSGPAGGDLDGTYPNPTVDGLRGYGLANVAPGEGQVLMFSGSAWRPVGEKGPGWPTVRTVNPAGGAHYTSLSAALSAANAGDVIELYGDVTVTAFELNKALTLRAVSPEITLTITASTSGLNITASGARVENITVTNTTAGTTAAIYCNPASGSVTLENVTAINNSGSTDRRGITVAAYTAYLINCEATATGGGGDDYGLLASGTTVVANIRGGKYTGDTDDIYVGSGDAANLSGLPEFVNGLVFVDSAGSMPGDYCYSGNTYQYNAANDIFIGGDEAGIKGRAVNIGQTSITDHFDGAALDAGWTWASYTGFVTPSTIDLSTHPSMLLLYNSTTTRAFAYRASAGSNLFLRAVPVLDSRIGVRFDDGTNDDYIEWFIERGSSGGLLLRYRYDTTGGPVVGPTTLETFDDVEFITLSLTRGANYNFVYYIDAPRRVTSGSVSVGTVGFTPTRTGIMYELVSGSGNIDRSTLVDWYKQT